MLAEELCVGNGGENFSWATEHSERERLWKARHNCWYAIKATYPGKHAYSTDVVVPVSHLPETVLYCHSLAEEMGVPCPIVGHVGDGNFHCFLLSDQVCAILLICLSGQCTWHGFYHKPGDHDSYN